jgi:hypothetical protein
MSGWVFVHMDLNSAANCPPLICSKVCCTVLMAMQVVGRSKLLPPAAGAAPGSPRLPVAHMVCNQSPPVDGQPSLMTFRWVLFGYVSSASCRCIVC